MPIVRRDQLTGPRHARAVEAIRRGATLKTAARAAGVTWAVLKKWLERGERDTKGPYREFWLDVMAAYAEIENEMLDHIRGAAAKDWRAALKVLQNIERDTYADKPSLTFGDVTPEEIIIRFPEDAQE